MVLGFLGLFFATYMQKLFWVLAVLGIGVCQVLAAVPPALQWGSLARNTNSLGSANAVRAMAVDGAGNTFITANLGTDGVLLLDTNRITAGASGGNDILLAKLDPAGNWLWVKNSKTAIKCTPYALAADAAGNCYLAGTIGPAFMGNGTSIFNTNNVELGIYDYTTWLTANDLYAKAFVAKFSPAGQCQWVRGARGGSYSEGYTVAVSANGNVTFGGKFGRGIGFGPATPVSSQNYQFFTSNTVSGGEAPFVATYDSTGNFLWAAAATNAGLKTGTLSLSTDSANNVVVAGLYSGTQNWTTGAVFSDTNSSLARIFVMQFATNGVMNWTYTPPGTTKLYDLTDGQIPVNIINPVVHVRSLPGDKTLLAANLYYGSDYVSAINSFVYTNGFTYYYRVGDFGNGKLRSLSADNSAYAVWLITLNSAGQTQDAFPVFAPRVGYTFTSLNNVACNGIDQVVFGIEANAVQLIQHTNGVYLVPPSGFTTVSNFTHVTLTGVPGAWTLDWTRSVPGTTVRACAITPDGLAEFGGGLVSTGDFGGGTVFTPTSGAAGHDLLFGRFQALLAPNFGGPFFINGNGHFVFNLGGQVGQSYLLQSSTDLATWLPVSTNTLGQTSLTVTNVITPGTARKFFRTKLYP